MEVERKTSSNRSPFSTENPGTEYRPIACSVYDVFEAAALRHRPLQLTIAGNTGEYVIHDIFSKGKEEFLSVSPVSGGKPLVVRLDNIELVVDPSDKKSYFPYDC